MKAGGSGKSPSEEEKFELDRIKLREQTRGTHEEGGMKAEGRRMYNECLALERV